MFSKPDAYAPRAEATVGSGRSEAGPHPLDVEAEALGCLVSDLRFDARLRAHALYNLIGFDEGAYTLRQWTDAANYLTESECSDKSVAQVKQRMAARLAASMEDRWMWRDVGKRM